MFIVAYTLSADGSPERGQSDWALFETLDAAREFYWELMDGGETYSATITAVVQSTCYDPAPEFAPTPWEDQMVCGTCGNDGTRHALQNYGDVTLEWNADRQRWDVMLNDQVCCSCCGIDSVDLITRADWEACNNPAECPECGDVGGDRGVVCSNCHRGVMS